MILVVFVNVTVVSTKSSQSKNSFFTEDYYLDRH